MEFSGRITTHVLDVSRGQPAMGMNVQLWSIEENGSRNELLGEATVNADGRIDEPLLSGEKFLAGDYEIIFEAGRYFQEIRGIEPLLFDRIPIRFRVADAEAHFHVPLLVAPGGYSTYRGS